MHNPAVPLPLDGLKVIDFSANAAGPSCTQLLANFGAEVIKIEPPGGDSTRQWGAVRVGPDHQFTPTFLSMNMNKASVVIDLKLPEGLAQVRALMQQADVVVESFAPGVAKRLGIGYDDVAQLKPGIVYCSISGYGQTGPMTSRPGFDMLMQAYAGHMSITGETGRPSVRSGPSSIDLLTGAHAAFGIMTALRHRDATGVGQMVDVSLFDSAVYMVCNHLSDCLATGRLPDKFGSQFPLLSPYGVFQARDREFYLGVSSDSMWNKLCGEIGRPELAQDARFRDNAGRVTNRGSLHEILLPVLEQHDAVHWVDIALRLGIPVSLVHNLQEVAEHPQTQARGLLVDTGVDGLRTVGAPLKLSRTPAQVRRGPPRLGEDNKRLLARTSAGVA
jgi:crotonobetainyl-CoA:carnitine CoA-transferase CaiB-like acyl-CoA transferase